MESTCRPVERIITIPAAKQCTEVRYPHVSDQAWRLLGWSQLVASLLSKKEGLQGDGTLEDGWKLRRNHYRCGA